MLREWAALSPDDALDLLDAGFAHSVGFVGCYRLASDCPQAIRSYAVGCLSILSDDRLISYLLQLTQVNMLISTA